MFKRVLKEMIRFHAIPIWCWHRWQKDEDCRENRYWAWWTVYHEGSRFALAYRKGGRSHDH